MITNILQFVQWLLLYCVNTVAWVLFFKDKMILPCVLTAVLSALIIAKEYRRA